MSTVSIIIPVYNRANIVSRTLKTVLEQTYRPLQVILVDNFSTDDSMVVLNQFKIDNDEPDFEVIITQEKHQTASAARNRGMQFATGDYLMFFDSDDLMDRRLVQKYVNAFQSAQRRVDIVIARRNQVNEIGEKQPIIIFFTVCWLPRHSALAMISSKRLSGTMLSRTGMILNMD